MFGKIIYLGMGLTSTSCIILKHSHDFDDLIKKGTPFKIVCCRVFVCPEKSWVWVRLGFFSCYLLLYTFFEMIDSLSIELLLDMGMNWLICLRLDRLRRSDSHEICIAYFDWQCTLCICLVLIICDALEPRRYISHASTTCSV